MSNSLPKHVSLMVSRIMAFRPARTSVACLALFCGCLLPSQVAGQETRVADVIMIDAKIYTADQANPTAEAIAWSDDRILAVGTREAIADLAGPDTVWWSAGGRCVTPGWIEGHGHFVGLGESLQMLDLAGAKSWQDVVAQVEAAAAKAPPGQWIVGRGWHQEKWTSPPADAVDGYPRHDALSQVSPQNPVWLTHASGHASFANDYAMKLASIDDKTLDPPGGEILKAIDPATGEARPIGVFRETAASLVQRIYNQSLQREDQAAKRERFRASVRLAAEACLAHGITTFQDAGSSVDVADGLTEIADQHDLPIRLWVMIRDSNEQLDRHLKRLRRDDPVASPYLTIRAVKRSIDGALGPHGAWLLQPYSDLSSSIGLNTATVPSVEETARIALRENYQVCVHAIGDRANREVLDLYERVWEESFADLKPSTAADWQTWGRTLRWRIEHAQHLSPGDLPRFAQLGVIPAMQGIHCPSDAVYVLQRLGYRRAAEGAYKWRTLIDQGVKIANGTDAPVERLDPIASFYASITRRLPTAGNNEEAPAFFPEEAMTRQEALLSYTLWAAEAAFQEQSKGSLTPGKWADLTVWSQDLMTCPTDRLPATKAVGTIVGGQLKFQDPTWTPEIKGKE